RSKPTSHRRCAAPAAADWRGSGRDRSSPPLWSQVALTQLEAAFDLGQEVHHQLTRRIATVGPVGHAIHDCAKHQLHATLSRPWQVASEPAVVLLAVTDFGG